MPSAETHTHRPAPAPAEGEPIHAHSHSAQLEDPTRINTSSLTLAALQEHGILDAVIGGIAVSVPHGERGEHTDADDDSSFEEKGMQSVSLSPLFSVRTGTNAFYSFQVCCTPTPSSSKAGSPRHKRRRSGNGQKARRRSWARRSSLRSGTSRRRSMTLSSGSWRNLGMRSGCARKPSRHRFSRNGV